MTNGGLWQTGDVLSKERLNQKTVYVGSTAPTETYAGQIWFDTSSNVWKVRNSNNSSWIPCYNLPSLQIGGTEVITSGRVLQNVTADVGIITSGVFSSDRIPGLDASKITSGLFSEDRIPHIFSQDVTFNQRGIGAGLRMLYVGDETEKSVYGTTETEIKNFRMVYNTSHGRKFSTIYFHGEAKVTGGTGYFNVSIDGGTSQTVWTITTTSYSFYEGSLTVSWSDNSIHTISLRLKNSGSYYTYNRTIEVYVE